MKIPDGWSKYKSIGNVIEGTRFIAFKVPLKENCVKQNLPPKEWFTPKSLLSEVKDGGRELGLIIDLTNTTKYYDKNEFLNVSVEYAKIFTAGHVVPSIDVCEKFKQVVNDFLSSNSENELLIGVHCTHGLNRTGYLVCRYMIDHLSFEPDVAIKAFNTARGHDIERENYLKDLRSDGSVSHAESLGRSDEEERLGLENQTASSSSANGHNHFSTNRKNGQRYSREREFEKRQNNGYQARSRKCDFYNPEDRSNNSNNWRSVDHRSQYVSRGRERNYESVRPSWRSGDHRNQPYSLNSRQSALSHYDSFQSSRQYQDAGWSSNRSDSRDFQSSYPSYGRKSYRGNQSSNDYNNPSKSIYHRH
ncbi:RNA/RNP complex-1-interacting phosphatase [Patella vulgata]|uniref:RNA/RNP complex-1-interacting phosphatase n=1 Tax=Patella vulgata TaxID=6465 RepID=UPI0021803E8C|nr:RNA/RNP complex-1-interacting phosphatase [Patella vulgata]